MSIHKLLRAIDVVCNEPYRLFFPLGIWMGLVGVSPWILYGFGFAESYSGLFHSSIQMMVYMNCFVIGFLTTFVPRFTATARATRAEVFSFFLLFIGIAIFLGIELWGSAYFFYILLLTALIRFALVRRPPKKEQPRTSQPPHEMIWVPLAILHGIVGSILSLLGKSAWFPMILVGVGKPMMEQGFLFGIVIGVAGFMIPRLMGTYQRNGPQVKEGESPCCELRNEPVKKEHPVRFHLLMALGFFVSFWLEGFGLIHYAYLLRALVATMEFVKNRTLSNFPVSRDFYVKLAWISAWMVVLGLWLAGIFPEFHVVMLHVSFIGGFSLMTYAVGTMVVLSHIGQAQKLKRSLLILWIILLGLALALMKRTVVIFYPEPYFKFMGLASVLWSIVAVCWVLYILPKVFIVPRDDEFERMHEQAKEEA